MEVKVKSLPLKEVLTDIANRLNTEVEKECEVYTMRIPERHGKGHIKGVNFGNGLGYIKYDCVFRETTSIKFVLNRVHPAKFLYVSRGPLIHRFEDESNEHLLKTYQSAIVASNGNFGHVLTFEGNRRYEIESVEINRDRFAEHVLCEIEEIDVDLVDLFRDTEASKTFYHEGAFSLKLNDMLRSIDAYPRKGLAQRLFLAGMTYLTLTEQIEMYHEDKLAPEEQLMLRKPEIENLLKCVEKILNDFSQYEGVKKLAESAGMNENKLRAAFKVLYKSSVSDFFKNARLTKSAELLKDSDLSISEVVTYIGLTNGGHFSKLFKERYAMTPGEYRSLVKRNRILYPEEEKSI